MASVIERAVTILKLLIPQGGIKEWGASEIAYRSGIPVGTVHRILLELKKHGLVAQNDVTKKFRLGLLLMELGFIARENLSIMETAKPVLKNLMEKTKETAHLTIQDGYEGVLIDKIETMYELRTVQPIGMRTPLTRGALKKAILAFLPSDEINDIIEKHEKAKNRPQIMSELEDIRLKGYAISFGEVTCGTAAIATPVFDFQGKVVASIGIMGPATRFTQEEIPQKIKYVMEAGALLTKNIRGHDRVKRN
ncbi:IclR family transcriptional regulator [Calderihabitans maritimus]|uniref:IclR family transcriptional regulator n=1 Tax=Calderihabitans maritimus TaxID=1246530 RepID=A0A1Z5HRV1_9FIRM|nr:IclR family transcriptional regulator [Calderihabitans maritimus]GAW92244.1 IclR family transcriptional regulator [Calderihabitans maritimus]